MTERKQITALKHVYYELIRIKLAHRNILRILILSRLRIFIRDVLVGCDILIPPSQQLFLPHGFVRGRGGSTI